MDKKEFLKKGFRNLLHNGVTYFSVYDIKVAYADVKFDTGNAIQVGGDIYVTAEAVEQMTEFDKKIKQSLNFDPRKKVDK